MDSVVANDARARVADDDASQDRRDTGCGSRVSQAVAAWLESASPDLSSRPRPSRRPAMRAAGVCSGKMSANEKPDPETTPRPLTPDEVRHVKLFRDVTLENVWHMLAGCPTLELAPEEELIRVGDTDSNTYLVLSGTLRVHLGTPADEAVATIGPGDSVGELAALDKQPRSAAVVAAGPSRVLVLTEGVFWSLLNSSHELTLNLLNVLSQRLRGNNATLTESRQLQEQYRRHASVDAVTGLHNRRWLNDIAPRLMRRMAMKGDALSLVMIDVDHFKKFNDDHGHPAGDYVLFAVAQVLKSRLRPTDIVARYGGEEFTVVLPETPLSGAQVAADRVRRAIQDLDLLTPDDRPLPGVTASMGVAEMVPGESFEALVERADAALYEAKRAGRNRVRMATRRNQEE
jgi:diguanylate cyclase (GGDEF)-like protein